ncbi:MAG TPA: hypothetical protein V6C78_24600, partial [Crinalium sp.]
HVEPSHPHRCTTLSNVGSAIVHLEYEGGTESLAQGESCILPAAIGEVRIVPANEASLVACYVPDLQRDVIAPLRSVGYSDAQIRELGDLGLKT